MFTYISLFIVLILTQFANANSPKAQFVIYSVHTSTPAYTTMVDRIINASEAKDLTVKAIDRMINNKIYIVNERIKEATLNGLFSVHIAHLERAVIVMLRKAGFTVNYDPLTYSYVIRW